MLPLLAVAVVDRVPGPWVPAPVARWGFDVRLALGPLAKGAWSVAGGSLLQQRVRRPRSGQDVVVPGVGLSLAGTIYRPEGMGPRVGVLLLHGSVPDGRRSSVPVAVATALAERGYVVLALDHRGFGDSDDPARTDDPSAFAYVGDARRALAYLAGVEGVDGGALAVVGHSFGADVALGVAVSGEPLAGTVVAIGPSRDVPRQFDGHVEYWRRRLMRYGRLPTEVPADVYRAMSLPLCIESQLGSWSRAGHVPLLLMDGGRESVEDRTYLRRVFDQMAEPKAYVTIAGADHYLDTARLGSFVIYDQAVLSSVAERIDQWIRETLARP